MLKSFLILFLTVLLTALAYPQQRSLDYYLNEGLNNSPMLKDYDNQLRTARIDSLLALCVYKPLVSITSQALLAPSGKNYGYDEAITNGGNYAALVGVKQPLFNEKARSAQLENLHLLRLSLGLNKIITQTDLKKSITLQYITACAGFELLNFDRKVNVMLIEQQKEVQALVEAGIYQQTDLMNLLVSGKAQEISCKQQFIQYKNDLSLLNLLCGIVDTTTVELIKPVLELNKHFDLLQSPVILQSRLDSLKNGNALKQLELNYRPRLEAFADAGFMAITPMDIPKHFGGSLGLNLTMPLYDGRQRELESNKLKISEYSRTLYRDFYITQYSQQYRQLYEQVRLNDNLIASINIQISQQKELIDMYKIEIEKGLVRFTDYLAAINNYTNTVNSLAIADMNRLQLINQLNFLK